MDHPLARGILRKARDDLNNITSILDSALTRVEQGESGKLGAYAGLCERRKRQNDER